MQKLQSSYPSSTQSSTPPVFVSDDGRALPLMPVGDDWGCKARDLGRLLGYSADGKNLMRKITKDWTGELLEGVDFLRGFNGVSETETPEDAIQAHEVILTRSGINMVCILTRKPMGTKIRRWLAEDVMVQIAETGSYGKPDPIVTLTEALVPALNGITTALQSITSRLDALEKRSTTVERTTTRIEHRAPEPRLPSPGPAPVVSGRTIVLGSARLELHRVGNGWGCYAVELGRVLGYSKEGRKFLGYFSPSGYLHDRFMEGVHIVRHPRVMLTMEGMRLACVLSKSRTARALLPALATEPPPDMEEDRGPKVRPLASLPKGVSLLSDGIVWVSADIVRGARNGDRAMAELLADHLRRWQVLPEPLRLEA